MYRTILTAGLLSLGLGTAVFAQTPTNPNSFQPPGDWNATIAGAMFSDVTTGAVRPADEITSNFAALSAEDQAAVRDYCKRFDPSTAGTTTTPMGKTTGPSSADNEVAVREVCTIAGKL